MMVHDIVTNDIFLLIVGAVSILSFFFSLFAVKKVLSINVNNSNEQKQIGSGTQQSQLGSGNQQAGGDINNVR